MSLARRSVLFLALGGCGLAAPRAPDAGAGATLQRYEFQQAHMGTTFRVVCYAAAAGQADAAAAQAFAKIAALDQMLSDYLPASELNQLSDRAGAAAAVPVSPDLWAVLKAAKHWAAATTGAFDPTLGACVRLWRRSRRQESLPRADRLQAALATCGWQHLSLTGDPPRARLEHRGTRLDLGGIAKGYALDQALLALRLAGCPRALVDGGGDLALGDPPPGEDGWWVELADPFPATASAALRLRLARCAVATSGDLYQRVEIDGRNYSHILDPATGLGVQTRVAASVVAASATQADALASAACVLGGAGVRELLPSFEGASFLLRGLDAEGARWSWRSPNFPHR